MTNRKVEREKITPQAAATPDDAREDSKPTQRRYRNQSRGNGEVADYATIDAIALLQAISAVCARGCAIRLGYTRDGGAYAIGIVGDGEPYTEYVRPTEDVALYLRSLAEDFGG